MKDSDSVKHQDVSTVVSAAQSRPAPPAKKVLFSSKGHNMQYFDIEGIKQRTSYSNIEDLYTAVVKEQLDNEVDWERDNYEGSQNEKITVVIKVSKDKVNYKFRNSNPQNIEIVAFYPEILNEIFNFDKTYGSKQNRHVFGRRGLFGDASKFIGGIAYAIIHSQGAKDNAFFNTQWKEPICFRSNGKERRVFIEVNRAANIVDVDVTESEEPVPFIDTEVEISLPIIKSDPDELSRKIERFCRWYVTRTRDINFDINLNGKQIVKKQAVEPIPKCVLPSVMTYNPEEFVRFFLGFDDRHNITVYDVLTQLKEGTQIPKKEFDSIVGSDVFRTSIAEFMDYSDYESKLKAL